MRINLQHKCAWLESLPTCNAKPNILLLSGDGQQVPVPAPLLLAASPLVRSILTGLLPPAYSQCIISLPSATGDMLLVFADILTKGIVAADNSDIVGELKQIMRMLGIEASLVSPWSEEVDTTHMCEVGEGEESTQELSATNLHEDIVQYEIIVKLEEKETDSGLDCDGSNSSEDSFVATSSSSESSDEVLGIVNEQEGFGIILKPCTVRVERYLYSSSLATKEGRCEEETSQLVHQGDVRVRDDALDGTEEGVLEEGSIQDCEEVNVKDKYKNRVLICPKCGRTFKYKRSSHESLNRHILSHYYKVFFDVLPRCKPFPCPICGKFSRDRFTMVRHYAFTHKMVYKLTDLSPEDLPGIADRGSGASMSESRLLKKNLVKNIIGQPVENIATDEDIATDCVSEEQENIIDRGQTIVHLLSEQEINLEKQDIDKDIGNKGWGNTSVPLSGLGVTRCRALHH